MHRVTAPTLVVWGENDRMVPLAHGEAYARSIPKAKPLQIVKAAGHSVHVEMPEFSAQRMLDFLLG